MRPEVPVPGNCCGGSAIPRRPANGRPSARSPRRADRFAIGKLGLLVGLPDEGKGQILADMAARVTRGAEWPCDEGRAPQGNIVLLSAEDDAGDTVVPRLLAADANLDRVEIVNMVRDARNCRRQRGRSS
jgi:hypothetical protein